jgi:GNAT superfamily N-acetyltransferase
VLTYVRELPCRPVNATDFAALKLLHAELFPVEYDDVFFHKTTRGLDGIVSWAALRPPAHLHRQLPVLTQLVGAPAAAAVAVGNGAAMPPSPRVMRASHVPVITGGQQLAGFITARFGTVAEVDAHHRHLLGLANSAVASQSVFYILTLGVVEVHRRHRPWNMPHSSKSAPMTRSARRLLSAKRGLAAAAQSCRQQGVATQLLRLLLDHAAGRQCRLVYLHVITYNHAAIRFYERMGFCSIATLQNFYIIR